jgi:hypothetical protein
MLKQLITVISLIAILTSGCATPPSEGDRASFAELCQALGKTDGKISKEEFLAAIPIENREQAAKLLDQCELSPEGVLTVEEWRRENWPIRELIRLTPPPKLTPPRGGRK